MTCSDVSSSTNRKPLLVSQPAYEALAREKKLKGWTRARKIELIEATNPTWVDLAAEL
jgi:predicted GIY-YIG superfamily endonuclease